MLGQPAGALFWKPGLSKTRPTIDTADVLIQNGVIRSCLVVAPIRVATNVWPAEIEKWAPHLKCTVLHGRTKRERCVEPSDFYTINPEGFSWLTRQKEFEWPDMLVLDESTKWKNWSAQRTKLLRKHLGKFSRRYALTGTPISNGYMDLFAQIFMLDCGESLGRYISHYRNEYFYRDPYQPYTWLMFPGAEEQIQKSISHLVNYVSEAELKELPDLVTTRIPVELPPKARRIYNEIEEHFFAEVDDGVIDAANSGVKSGKLRQAASGAVYGNLARDKYAVLHEVKIQALADLIEEIAEPVIVVYEWKHELERVQRYLDVDVPFLSGKSDKQTDKIIERWNAGKTPILMLHPASAGHGLNMQGGGNNVIFLNPTWDLEYREQVIGRLRRKGQEHSQVFCYEIEATNTVDQLVRYKVNAKANKQAQLFEKLVAYRKDRGI